MPDSSPSNRKSRALAALALVLALVALPIGAWASHQYGDVPDANPFHGDITAVTNAGITSGCGGGNYCPDRNVTRAEMAAFMNRLGALAANKTPVANATTVDRYSANELVRFAYDYDDSLALVGASGTILSTTITAPKRGFLQIVASSDVYNYVDSDIANCNLDVDGTNITASWRTFNVQAGNLEENCSTDAGYLTCGGAHTITFEASSVGANTNFDESTLEVIFIPFNGTGGTVPIFSCLIILPSADWSPANGVAPE